MTKVSNEMKRILFSNTRKLIIEEGSLTNPDNVLLALTVNKKLEQYGYSLDASAIRALSTQTPAEMANTWKEIEQIVRDVSGANMFNGPLFYANFPEEVMAHTDAELYLNSLFYYAFAQTNDKLSQAIADELQSMMSETKSDRLPLLEQFPRELKIVNKGTEDDLLKMMDARMHSLNMSEQQFEELKRFSEVYKSEFDNMLSSDTAFQSKETKVKIATMLHDDNRDREIGLLLKDSVDVLRFAAMLSKRNGIEQNNVELKPTDGRNIAFKLKNSEKKLIRNLLNNCNGLYSDIWRQEKLFKSLMNRLGTTKNDGCPVRVTLAFDNLALGHKVDEKGNPIYNVNKLIPDAIKHLNTTGDASMLEKVAKDRPGDFLRAYASTVAKTNEEHRKLVIDMVRHCSASDSVPMKTLLTVREQLGMQDMANAAAAAGTPEAKVYKHHGKHYVKTNTGMNLSSEDIAMMRETLKETAAEMVRNYQQLGKVYVDPALAGVKAPGREMRDASGGSVLTPYSTIDMDANKNLLVFGIRWEGLPDRPDERWLDVDLSVHMYDGDFNSKGHVSYTNLRDYCAVHSGDFTSIPECGYATEAIITDKSRLAEQGIKYLVAEVHCFSIESFRKAGNCKFVYEQKEGSFGEYASKAASRGRSSYDGLSGIAGHQNGVPVFLGEVFEPGQLENCIDLNSDGTTTVPLVYDVESDRILWLDMTLDNKNRNMPRNTENPMIMTSVMAEIERAQHNPYPNVKDLVECYAMYNGELTADITEAQTVFSRYNIDAAELNLREDARVITGFDLDILSKEFSGNDDQSMIVKEEPKVEEQTQYVEPPLVRQFRYLHQKLEDHPRGVSFDHDDKDDISNEMHFEK